MKRASLIVGTLVAFLIALVVCKLQPGGSGVVASLTLPDGSEYMVTQRRKWSVEPYTVAFYMRSKSGDPWGWCYVDHEAHRWREVVMTHDLSVDTIIVTERGTRRAVLDRKLGTFWIDNGGVRRALAAPQDFRQPEFAFR